MLKSPVFIAISLFLCSLLIRLWGIGAAPIHPDEVHWLHRSARVVSKISAAPFNTTTHLGHPGIVPSLVMALSQSAAGLYNATRGIQWDHPEFIDSLTASRASLAVLTSAIAPILFLGALPAVGIHCAALAAGMLALDPHLISTSRLAHLDATLALFVLITALLYYEAQQNGRVRTTLLSGVYWGLALATKIAGALVLPGLVVWNCIEWARTRRTPPIQWKDFGCALLGLATLTALWTRLWHHESDFKVRL